MEKTIHFTKVVTWYEKSKNNKENLVEFRNLPPSTFHNKSILYLYVLDARLGNGAPELFLLLILITYLSLYMIQQPN